jgi:AcrR family transcriptional regulator
MKEALISSIIEKQTINGKTYHHGDLPNALLQSALEILEQDGIQALSLRAVARRAGVSQAAPYHHFKDKLSLFGAVATYGMNRLADTCNSYYDPDLPGYQSLMTLGVGYLAFAKDNPNLFRLMFGVELSDYYLEANDKAYLEAIEATSEVRSRAVNGAFDQVHTSNPEQIEQIAVSVWAIVHGFATLIVDRKLEFPPTDSPEFQEHAIRHFVVFDNLTVKRAE